MHRWPHACSSNCGILTRSSLPREAELLSLLTEGLSNRDLGKRLFISEATVKTHLAHIYAKLGVETRAAAIATAIRREGDAVKARGWLR